MCPFLCNGNRQLGARNGFGLARDRRLKLESVTRDFLLVSARIVASPRQGPTRWRHYPPVVPPVSVAVCSSPHACISRSKGNRVTPRVLTW